MLLFRSWYCKICCISRMNWWIELILDVVTQFRKDKSYFNKFYVGLVKTWCGLLVHETLKSAISGEWIDELSWFFSCLYKFMKAKKYFNNFWVGGVKNGHGTLGDKIVKFAISEEWIDESSWFFACWYKFMKAKNYVNDFWVDRVMDFRW